MDFAHQTSQERFHYRIRLFKLLKKSLLVHHFWWFTHNCVAHPLIGVCPVAWTFQFHDFTSGKINGR